MTAHPGDTGLLAPGWAGSAAASATSDDAFLRALLDAEAALTRAQAAAGLAPAEAATAVTGAAGADTFDVRSLAERARTGGNPVIPLVADLTKAVGDIHGPYVHRGATSQDIMDTAMMLVAARTLDPVLADLGRTEQALSRLAAEHRDTAMPGRTLTQHAVPTTFGLKAAGRLGRGLALLVGRGGVGVIPPMDTMRSIACRARDAMSGGTVMRCCRCSIDARTLGSVVTFM